MSAPLPPTTGPGRLALRMLVNGPDWRSARSARAELAGADLHRLHIELVLDAVQNLVADLPAVPQVDDLESLRGQGLVAEPPEGAHVLYRAVAVVGQGRGPRPPLHVARAQLLEMRGPRPRLAGELLEAGEGRLRRRVPRALLLLGQREVSAQTEAA